MEVVAIVRIFGPGRDGLPEPVENGLRPSFGFRGELVACEVWVEGVDGSVPLDTDVRAQIRVPYGSELGWRFVGGEFFTLNIASRVIGHGTVLP